MSTPQRLDEQLDQLASQAMLGRAVLLLSEDIDVLTEQLGFMTESIVDFGHEIIRLDGVEPISPNTFIDRLVDLLRVDESALTEALALRASQGNPVVFVLDSAHCFSDAVWEWFGQVTRHPVPLLGLILGGEQDCEEFAATHSVQLAMVAEVASGKPEINEASKAPTSSGTRSLQAPPLALSGRYVAAIVGLVLILWLFWSVSQKRQEETVTELISLPVPETVEVEGQSSEDEGAGAAEARDPETELGFSPPVVTPLEEPEVVIKEEAPAVTRSPAPASVVAPSAPPSSTASAPAKAVTPAEARAADWLLLQADAGWMLQVLSAANEPGALQAVSELGATKSAYYQATRHGRRVYIVLAGPYGSREDAVKATRQLPVSYREAGAFPRQLSAIKQEIRSGK